MSISVLLACEKERKRGAKQEYQTVVRGREAEAVDGELGQDKRAKRRSRPTKQILTSSKLVWVGIVLRLARWNVSAV